MRLLLPPKYNILQVVVQVRVFDKPHFETGKRS